MCGCQVSGIVVGEGFRFGYKAAGDTRMLQELGAAHSMDVSIVSLVSSGCTEGPDTVRCLCYTGNSLSIWHALHHNHPLDEVCSGCPRDHIGMAQ